MGRTPRRASLLIISAIQRPLIKLETALLVRQDSVELRDLRIAGSDGSVLGGNLTLPINLLAALDNPSAASLLKSSASASGQISAKAIRLEELGELAGRRLPYRGAVTFELAANGPLPSLEGRLQVAGKDLAFPNGATVAGVNGAGSLSAGQIFVHAELNPQAARDQATLDFGGGTQLLPARLAEGKWLDPESPISGQLATARLNTSVLQPWIPAARAFKGDIAGAVNFAGTWAKPDLTGRVTFLETTWQTPWLERPLEKLRGDVLFSESALFWESITGKYRRGGTFTATGTTGFTPGENVALAIAGKHLEHPSLDDLDAVADADLQLQGAENDRLLSGDIHFLQGTWRKREVTFSLGAPTGSAGAFALPELPSDWKVALKVTAATPMSVAGTASSWQLQPYLEIGGTAEKPIFTGEISLRPAPGEEILVSFSKTSLENGFVGEAGAITPVDPAISALWLGPTVGDGERLRLGFRRVP